MFMMMALLRRVLDIWSGRWNPGGLRTVNACGLIDFTNLTKQYRHCGTKRA
jgi:hypothetical protein